MIEGALLKYYEELNLLEEAVFVLAEEEEDRYINNLITKIETHIDIFLINEFPKDHLAYDNVYAFSSKDYQFFDKIKYDIIQNNNPYSSHQINKVIKYYNKVKEGGLLILTLIDKKCVSHIEEQLDFSPKMWHEKDGVAIYKKA